jgi:hypothetical protein
MGELPAKTHRLPLLVAVLALLLGAALPAQSASSAQGHGQAVVGAGHGAESALAVAHPRTPGQPPVVGSAVGYGPAETRARSAAPDAHRAPPQAPPASAASIRGPPA